jgi:hypothetical protein
MISRINNLKIRFQNESSADDSSEILQNEQGWQLGGVVVKAVSPRVTPVRSTATRAIRPQFVLLAIAAILVVVIGIMTDDKKSSRSLEAQLSEAKKEYDVYLESLRPLMGDREVERRRYQSQNILNRLTVAHQQVDLLSLRREATYLTDLDRDANSPLYRLGIELFIEYQAD